MKGTTVHYVLLSSFFCVFQLTAVMGTELPAVTHYKLNVRFQLKEQRVGIVATLSIKNTSARSHSRLPFLLYRLLTVKQVHDLSGLSLPFKQDIVQLHDEPSLQAREVVVDLRSPLKPRDSVTIMLSYDGFIFGYPEVMAYVKDRIDENYSLLRPDTYAYPVLAGPTFASVLAANDTKFTYDMTVTVPKDYRVAHGGETVDVRIDADSSTFTFRSKLPTWRIDVAVAKFRVLNNPDDQLVVYHLPQDSVGARSVMLAARDVLSFYIDVFGRPTSYKGYTIIEIPDGWGSQAGDYYFLQTAAAFTDSLRISEVYHEIAHSWNATPAGDVQRCRFFDEGFASFFEALAIQRFDGERALQADMERSRSNFVQWGQYDPQVLNTPIAGYGLKELGRHSYTKGAWSLYVLYRLVGEKTFASIIRNMVNEFTTQPIDFKKFQNLCERVAKRNLQKFFQEWIYGIESSNLLVDKVPIADIVARY